MSEERETSRPSTTRLRFEAYTDWLAIVAITILVAIGRVPWEWGLGVIGTIAGVTGALKGMGKPGGSLTLIIGPILKLLQDHPPKHLL
jgi:hypothetical protein